MMKNNNTPKLVQQRSAAPMWALVHREAAARRVKVHGRKHCEELAMDVDTGLVVLLGARDSSRDTLTAYVALALFRQAIEQLDAIEILLSAGAVRPAVLHLRTFLEAAWFTIYVIQRNDEHVAAAYILQHVLANVEDTAKSAKGHAPGSQPTIDLKIATARAGDLVREDPVFRRTSRELERLNQERLGANWYEAFNGPKNARALCISVTGSSGMYDSCYTETSRFVHGGRALDGVTRVNDRLEFSVLRRPTDTEEIGALAVLCHELMLQCAVSFMDYFYHSPEGAALRAKEIGQRYNWEPARKEWTILK